MARFACSVRRRFSRSAALTCALYCAPRIWLRTRPQRSGSQEASKGSVIWLVCLLVGIVALLETPAAAAAPLVLLAEVSLCVYPGPKVTLGKSCEWACAMIVRDSMKFSKAC